MGGITLSFIAATKIAVVFALGVIEHNTPTPTRVKDQWVETYGLGRIMGRRIAEITTR